MGKKEKLIIRLKSVPNDFTSEEAHNLLELLGFKKSAKGKTSGSRVKYINSGVPILLHKPHPRKELKEYQIKNIIEVLVKEGLI